MDTVYEDESYETILLVDTSIHAFNSVNRNALLGDLVAICPPIVNYSLNCHSVLTQLPIIGNG